MLAYYVAWHMRQVWRERMFVDEDQAAKLVLDPVVLAPGADAAMKKVLSLTLEEGSPVHSFLTSMALLSALCATLWHAGYMVWAKKSTGMMS